MTDEQMLNMAKRVVHNYFNNHRDVTDPPLEMSDIFIVWFCKTLQNWKALVSTNVRDGIYYEVTHNGDKRETYLDVYKKWENMVVEDETRCLME